MRPNSSNREQHGARELMEEGVEAPFLLSPSSTLSLNCISLAEISRHISIIVNSLSLNLPHTSISDEIF
ncbi:unnamed protein product [Cuscuta campestris]|uniref:Uncharacterized protein n=1 Tax=Cuscuta campestris TaxID=132261 RepID=A0A484LP98_9ASTE|nr:unnamed protein product [Cuscuta campestris]